MQKESFYINSKEYTAIRLGAFSASKHAQKLAKLIGPAIAGGGLDLKAITESMDSDMVESIVFPIFKECKVYSVEQSKVIDNGTAMDMCFTAETLFDFYELVYEVFKFQFGPLFSQLMNRFGKASDEANP